MPAIKNTTVKKNHGDVIVVNNMKDYSNDPFFLAQAEKARISVSKIKWPDELKNK